MAFFLFQNVKMAFPSRFAHSVVFSTFKFAIANANPSGKSCLMNNMTRMYQISIVHSRQPMSSTSRTLADLKYTKEHEWVRVDGGDVGTVGLSDHAQSALGDIVFVELPEMNADVQQNDQIGAVESVKSASDIYSPLSGTVIEVNEQLDQDPALINRSPLDEGWICKLKMSNASELDGLLSEQDYKKYLETIETDD